jgi:superfamily II DNA helicase RecQ
MANTNFSSSDLHIKTFQIQNDTDEQAVNEFLAGKSVRHWSASFAPATSLPSADGTPIVLGVWNVFVAYEIRQAVEIRPAQSGEHGRQYAAGGQPRKFSERSSGDRSSGSERSSGGGSNGNQRQSAPAPKADKVVTEDYKPQIADADFPLFDSVRKWRNTRAREARVKPYSFFNNRQLEELVTAKPENTDALRAIVTDMEAPLWEKYQNELLAFVETARGAGVAAPAAEAVA